MPLQVAQPLPFKTWNVPITSGVKPMSMSVLGGTSAVTSNLHLAQTRRTRRWAWIRLTAVPTRNGSMPMFTMRETVEGASLVCSVESTRWPVSAALTAISAVS